MNKYSLLPIDLDGYLERIRDIINIIKKVSGIITKEEAVDVERYNFEKVLKKLLGKMIIARCHNGTIYERIHYDYTIPSDNIRKISEKTSIWNIY